MTTTQQKEAKYDLHDYQGRRDAEAYFEQILSESYSTWDDPGALRDIDFDDYFEPTLFDGALYNSPACEDLRIRADQLDDARALFGSVNRRMYRDHLLEKEDSEGTLHVVRTRTDLAYDNNLPRLEATYREGQYEIAEKLAAAFEEHENEYSFTIWEERDDGSLVDYYTAVEPAVGLSDLS